MTGRGDIRQLVGDIVIWQFTQFQTTSVYLWMQLVLVNITKP